MVLEQLLLGILIAGLVVLLLPFLLVMAGIGATVLLSCVASAAILGVLVFWLMFPGLYGAALLRFALAIGLLLVDRRYRSRPLKGGPPLARAASIQLHRSDL